MLHSSRKRKLHTRHIVYMHLVYSTREKSCPCLSLHINSKLQQGLILPLPNRSLGCRGELRYLRPSTVHGLFFHRAHTTRWVSHIQSHEEKEGRERARSEKPRAAIPEGISRGFSLTPYSEVTKRRACQSTSRLPPAGSI